MIFKYTHAIAVFLLASARATEVTFTAALDYGTFRGSYNEQFNISYWQKIPYAAPPVGNLRFRGPQPPDPTKGIYDSSQAFSACPSRDVSGETAPLVTR